MKKRKNDKRKNEEIRDLLFNYLEWKGMEGTDPLPGPPPLWGGCLHPEGLLPIKGEMPKGQRGSVPLTSLLTSL